MIAVTKVDFRDILTKAEYMSLTNFLAIYIKPFDYRTTRIRTNNLSYQTRIASLNVYSAPKLVRIAEERLAHNSRAELRRNTLKKVIKFIKEN